MSELLKHLKEFAQHLDEIGLAWAIVGAIARNEYASEPRFTNDIDIAIKVASEEETQAVLSKLSAKGYLVLEAAEHPIDEHTTSARIMGLNTEHGRIFVDLIFRSTEIEDLIVTNAITTEVLPGLTLPIARRGHLIAMKVLALVAREREQEKKLTDEADMIVLLKNAKSKDLELARKSAATILERYTIDIPDISKKLEDVLAKYYEN